MRLAVHVTPRTARNEIVGWRGAELVVHVTAPPDSGKANQAVCRTVASALDVPKGAVRVVRGQTARHKLLEVDIDPAAIEAAFGAPETGPS